MLRLLNESHLLLDPLYGMMRRARVARLPRPVMLFEDQIFAARLALAGPFGHLDQVLSYRRSKPFPRLPATARRLGVPPWQAKVATTLQCRELLAAVREAELGPGERRQAECRGRSDVPAPAARDRSSPEPQAGRPRVACRGATTRPRVDVAQGTLSDRRPPASGAAVQRPSFPTKLGPIADLSASSAPPQLPFSAA